MPRTSQLTPMLRHYLEVKAENPDAILVYRMGDFYEMFFEDALRAAPVLEITLTARQKGSDSEAPMCGIPHHALEPYLGKLVRAGFKVAICEQMEDPAEAKGLVRREVIRVVTPGTLSEPALLNGKSANLLCGIRWHGLAGAGAFVDVSTGKLDVYRWPAAERALEDLMLMRPQEILFEEGELPAELQRWIQTEELCSTAIPPDQAVSASRAERLLTDQFKVGSLRGLGLIGGEPAVLATATALSYVHDTQHNVASHIHDLSLHEERNFLFLDETTVRNLDLFRNQRDGGSKATLLGLLDRTKTSMGGRALRQWLLRPLTDRRRIADRHDAVEELLEELALRNRVRERLGRIADLERIVSRAVLGSLTPREAAALRDSLAEVPALIADLSSSRAEILASAAEVDPAADLAKDLETTLEREPKSSLKQGGVIAAGVNVELDENRSLAQGGKRHILDLEERERQATGIRSLKVGFNRVFGYYLEVTKSHQDRVPESYVRKQTLANAERFFTPELKELEERILGAETRQLALEAEEFQRLRERISTQSSVVQRLADLVAHVDVLAAFADVAADRSYVRPKMGEAGDAIRIRGGRHPIVEQARSEAFVPNDCLLDRETSQIVLLTGPNMGGKSTYLRQIALTVLMAQAGSLVAADEAELGLVDRIFTRVGASDDLARGESTFMVEMIETANILRYATADSLVILDEVGRGTATFDGLSLAWAIIEHLHSEEGPKTVFATHYHELTELAAILPRVVNSTLAVKEWDDKIVFLRRVIPGSADKSYGLHVARLAGLPAEVLQRASEILANLERQEYDLLGRPRLAEGDAAPVSEGPDQLALFTPPEQLVASILRDVDDDQLTPLAALNLVHSLKARLNG